MVKVSYESELTKIERWLLSDGVAHCRGHGGAGGVRAGAELAVTEGVLTRGVLAARQSARCPAHTSGSGSSGSKLRGWIVVTT